MRTYLSRFPGKREGWGKGTTAEERETDGPTCVNSRDDESVRQDRDVRRKINEATGCGVDAHPPRRLPAGYGPGRLYLSVFATHHRHGASVPPLEKKNKLLYQRSRVVKDIHFLAVASHSSPIDRHVVKR